MTDIPELNLTAAVEAGARAAFIAAVSYNHSGFDPEKMTIAEEVWDGTNLPAVLRNQYRRIALATITPAIPVIAHQAWELGVDANNYGTASTADNPWPDPELEAL